MAQPTTVDDRRAGRRVRGMSAALAALALATAGAGLAGCGDDGTPAGEPSPTPVPSIAETITVTSPAFTEGGRIPERYTCKGGGERPPIGWSGEVGDAVSFAVIVDDPDAPGFTYVHWIAFDIAPDVRELPSGDLPAGVSQAANSAGGPTWTPPCPPSGEHHYRFTVYALKAKVGVAAGTEAGEAQRAIEAVAIRSGRLTGLYG